MKTINIIEVDYDGQMSPVKECQFEYVPRIDERIILPVSNNDPKVYQVKDVHHTPNEKTIVYVVHDYRSLQSVLQTMASKMV